MKGSLQRCNLRSEIVVHEPTIRAVVNPAMAGGAYGGHLGRRVDATIRYPIGMVYLKVSRESGVLHFFGGTFTLKVACAVHPRGMFGLSLSVHIFPSIVFPSKLAG